MKITALILAFLMSLALFSCAQNVIDNENHKLSNETETTVEEMMALVDWCDFVRYNGKSYFSYFGQEIYLKEEQIGEKLGSVIGTVPSKISGDVEKFEIKDLFAPYLPIGTEFFAVNDMDENYFVAVRNNKEILLYSAADVYSYGQSCVVRGGDFIDDIVYAPTVVRLDDFDSFSACSEHIEKEYLRENYNAKFFDEKSLLQITLFCPSGSIEMEFVGVQKAGDTVYVFLTDNLQEEMTDDCAVWTAFVPCEKNISAEKVIVLRQGRYVNVDFS